MSNIDKQALRERYSPQPVPKCHICGAEMTVQRMSASRITYGCTGATYDDAGCHYAEGRSIADYHYEQSRVTVVDVSDPDVLALLDELEAAEKRIAELEARELSVHWPEPKDYTQGWKIEPEFISKVQDAIGYDEECQCWEGTPSMEMVEAVLIAAAGIGVKGE